MTFSEIVLDVSFNDSHAGHSGMLSLQSLKRLWIMGPVGTIDFARAGIELLIARLNFRKLSGESLQLARRTLTDPPQQPDLSPSDRELVERVRMAIGRAAYRLPLRSPCLIQALAARRWLGRYGIETSLVIGVRNDGAAPFEAHAWLMWNEVVVTGGDISGFTPLTGPKGTARPLVAAPDEEKIRLDQL